MTHGIFIIVEHFKYSPCVMENKYFKMHELYSSIPCSRRKLVLKSFTYKITSSFQTFKIFELQLILNLLVINKKCCSTCGKCIGF